MTDEVLLKFMLDSNRIEGEDRLNPGDLEAIKFVVEHMMEDEEDIWILHNKLGRHLNADWVGKYRTCNVRVGRYIAPDHSVVPKLMAEYGRNYYKMKSWEAHNEFQKIHPFQDLNGRVGRLIWLSRELDCGDYQFGISFLYKYYYQTLERYHSVIKRIEEEYWK